jgi:hypothetical protein
VTDAYARSINAHYAGPGLAGAIEAGMERVEIGEGGDAADPHWRKVDLAGEDVLNWPALLCRRCGQDPARTHHGMAEPRQTRPAMAERRAPTRPRRATSDSSFPVSSGLA